MKKTFLALAVAAVAAASVAQAATVYDKDGTSLAVYGRVQSVIYNGDTSSSSDYNDNSMDTSARLGLDMRTQLAPWVAGFGKVEWEAANGDTGEDDDDFNGRYLWVGFDFGQFGSVKFGKFEDAIKYAIAPTDIFEDFGCVAQLGNDDRRSGQMMYEWSGYGVDFKLSCSTASDNQQVDGAYYADEKLDINAGFAASVGYTSPDVLFGPISIKAGYSYAEFQGTDEDDFNTRDSTYWYDDYNQWAVSLSWGSDVGFYTAVMYQSRTFSMNSADNQYGYVILNDSNIGAGNIEDYTVQGVEFVVRYGFENGMSILAGYQWQNLDFDGATIGYGPFTESNGSYTTSNNEAWNGGDFDASAINLEFDYQITPNFKVWTEARWDVDTDEGYDTATNGVTNYEEDCYSIGARYTF